MSITSLGKPVVEEITRIRREVSDVMYQGISEEERRMAQQIAVKIVNNLQKEIEKNR